MATRTRLFVLLLALSLASGCSFRGNYSFSGTRKLLDSDVPVVTQIVFTPFVLVLDAAVSPVTAYMDAARHAPADEHLYLSFVGLRELWGSDLGVFYAAVGTLFLAPLDLAWFPVAGTLDTAYALTADEPLPRPVPAAPPHDEDSPTGRSASPSPDPAEETGRVTPPDPDR